MTEQTKKRQRTLSAFVGKAEPHSVHWSESSSLLTYNLLGELLPLVLSNAAPLRVAAFDLDETIIRTTSGYKFAKDEKDWAFLTPQVSGRLAQLSREGYLLVVFTNQLGVGREHIARIKENFKTKIESVTAKLAIPMILFAALSVDKYRKPCMGMWTHFAQKIVRGHQVDMEQSFYVGDAAGRPDGWKQGRRADHANVDRKFAHNVGLKFYTPEAFFLDEQEAEYEEDSFDPKALLSIPTPSELPLVKFKADLEGYSSAHVLIFVGYPASGKSTFFRRHLAQHGYTLINQDTLKTKARCLSTFREALGRNFCIAIDNTNASIQMRRAYIEHAREKGVPVRCVWFQTDDRLSRHLNVLRAVTKDQAVLPDVAFNYFKVNFEEPTIEEGFDQITKIPFIPTFDTEEERIMFSKYLI